MLRCTCAHCWEGCAKCAHCGEGCAHCREGCANITGPPLQAVLGVPGRGLPSQGEPQLCPQSLLKGRRGQRLHRSLHVLIVFHTCVACYFYSSISSIAGSQINLLPLPVSHLEQYLIAGASPELFLVHLVHCRIFKDNLGD